MLVLTLAVHSVAWGATLKFPYKLEGPGTYSLEVPKGDVWTVYNGESYSRLLEHIGNLKLDLEETRRMHEIEADRLEREYKLQLQHNQNVFGLRLEFKEDQVENLQRRVELLRKQSSTTFLGIPKSSLFFMLGILAGVYAGN